MLERVGEVDRWIEERFAHEPETALVAARARAGGLEDIAVSPNLGRFLRFLVELTGTTRALEIGTLGGYSSAWIARGLRSGGQVVTIERDEHAATVARSSLSTLASAARIEVRVGDAAEVLRGLDGEFEFLFLDGSQRDYVTHLALAKPLLRPGALIVADNVIWGGEILDHADSPSARYLETIRRDPDLDSVVLPIIRENLDGVALSRLAHR